MGEVIITDGVTPVDLTQDDPDVSIVSEQLTEPNPYFGGNMGETIDLLAFIDVATINAEIVDVTKYNNLQALRKSANPLSLKWNDDETTKPKLDHSNATGVVGCVIISLTLSQEKAMPPNNYKLTVKLGLNITA